MAEVKAEKHRWRWWVLFFVLPVMATACSGGGRGPVIDLSGPPAVNPAPVSRSDAGEELIFAVAAVNSPLSTFTLYEEMAHLLGERLGMPARLAGSRTYAEINSLVRSRDATLALVCSGAYVYGRNEFGMEPLVVPMVDGKTTYHSYLIVSAESFITGWEGLKGRSFAFTDPMSNSGRLVPIYELWKMGETPDSLFTRHIFTYSHDSSIKAVGRGLVDAAAVDSLVYDYLVSGGDEVALNTRVIWRSPPFGINPIVVNPNLDPVLKAGLRRELLDMHSYPAGSAILKRLGIQRFVSAEDTAYDSIRAIMDTVGIEAGP
ncbi:MAG: phosphate/phosphite/phosphonate ABC transporter substrate-binding protein [Dehalococcoidia bacterium]